MTTNKKFRDPVSRHINKNRTHYLKWCLTDDISVRYHYLHQNNRELEGQFILKLHSKSSYQLLDRNFAKQFIHSFRKDDFNMTSVDPSSVSDFELVEPDFEIFGALRPNLNDKLQYHKTIINLSTLHTESFFEGLDDTQFKNSFVPKVEEVTNVAKEQFCQDKEKVDILPENRVVVNDKVYYADKQHVHRIMEEDKLLKIEDHLIIYIKDDKSFMNYNVFHLAVNNRENYSYFPTIKRSHAVSSKHDFLNELKKSAYKDIFNFDKFGEIQFLCNIDDVNGYVGNNESNVYVVEYKANDHLNLHGLSSYIYTTTFELQSMEHLIKNQSFYSPKLNVKKIYEHLHSYFETDFTLNKNITIDEPNVQDTIRDIAVELNLVEGEVVIDRSKFDTEKIVYMYVSEIINHGHGLCVVAIEDEDNKGSFRLPSLMIPMKQDNILFNSVPYSVVDLHELYPTEWLCSKPDLSDPKLLITYCVKYLNDNMCDLEIYSDNVNQLKKLGIYTFAQVLQSSDVFRNVQSELTNYIVQLKKEAKAQLVVVDASEEKIDQNDLFNEYFIFVVDSNEESKFEKKNIDDTKILLLKAEAGYWFPKTRSVNPKKDSVGNIPTGFEELVNYYGMDYLCSAPSQDAGVKRDIFRVKYINEDIYDMEHFNNICSRIGDETVLASFYSEALLYGTFTEEVRDILKNRILSEMYDSAENCVE